MKKLWCVAAYEYRRNVFKKSFFLTLLSIPLIIALNIGVGLFIETRRDRPKPVGYVDQAGWLLEGDQLPVSGTGGSAQNDDKVPLVAFGTEGGARAALEAGDIQAYFILPVDYLSTREVELYYINQPGESAWRRFLGALKFRYLSDVSPEAALRIVNGTEFIVRSVDGRRQAPTGGPTFGLLMPLFVAIAFLVMLMVSSGYAMSAVVDEKENRTMEVLVTSISPSQLIGGKILGIVAISLTLLVCWSVIVGLGIYLGQQAGIDWLGDLSMDWRAVISVVVIGIPAYALAIALMVAIGAAVATAQEGQSVSTIVFILHLFPLYLAWSFISQPHSMVATFLSVFPLTSLMTIAARNLFTIVPAWQVAASIAIQMVCILGVVWLAGRTLRSGLLRAGSLLTFQRWYARSPRR
jgi:ABC-2 type transport system permease protein